MNFFYPFDGGRDAIGSTPDSSSRPRIRGPFILAVGGSKVRAGTTGMTGVLSEPGMRLKTATTAGDDQAVDAVRAGVENCRMHWVVASPFSKDAATAAWLTPFVPGNRH